MIKKSKIKKILIFKLCCLGDIVFITPALKALKNNFPDSEITILCSDWVKNIIEYIPEIDRQITFNPPFNESLYVKFKSAIKLINIIRKENFDLVLNGHRTNYFGLILKLSGIPYRLGFSETKFMNLTSSFEKSLNETERYLKILSDNGMTVKSKIAVFKPKSGIEIRQKYRINPGKKIIGIFPFGGINPGTEMDIKRWSFDNYIELSKRIIAEIPETEIILFEGKLLNEKINPELIKNPVGILIEEINPDLISVCNIFITGDTGPLHIAAAFGISTISLFGPSDPRLVAPADLPESGIKHLYIWKQPYCSPCYTPDTVLDKKNRQYWKGNNFICRTGTHECIKNIKVEEVFNELLKFLK